MITLGAFLRQKREETGLKQEELALAVFNNARHQSLISRWEADLVEPSLSNIRKIAPRLGISLGDLEHLNAAGDQSGEPEQEST